MSSDSKHRSHLPMPNPTHPRFIAYDAKDPDHTTNPIEQLRPAKGAPNDAIRMAAGAAVAPAVAGGSTGPPATGRSSTQSLSPSKDGVLMRSSSASVWTVTVFAALGVLSAAGCSKPPEPRPSEAKAAAPAAAQEQGVPTAEQAPAITGQSDATDDQAVMQKVRAPWKGDLDGMVERRLVRVLVPFRRPEYFYMEGKPTGVLVEAFQEMERVLNATYKTTAANRVVVALLPAPSEQVRDMLANGLGDIAAGSISITERNEAVADFSAPTLTGVKILVVTGPGAPALKSVDDLSGQTVWVNPVTRVKDDVEALNVRLKAAGKAPVLVKETDPALEPGDVLEMVNAGMYPITLAPSTLADFWAEVFSDVKVRRDLVVGEDVEIGWALQKGAPKLKAFVDGFLETRRAGTSFGNTLMRRYLEEAKYVRNATSPSEMRKFGDTAAIFRKYGDKYDVPYLLLVAQAYQESRLDQQARSAAGAVGIMQIKPSTAADAPVRIPDISTVDNNVHAGARLLRFLVDDYFDDPGLDRLNRVLFSFAAYNAGPAKIRRLRKEAQEMGFDPNTWFGNVEVAVAKRVGRETTQYVANIYKYYLAYRLSGEIAQQREQATRKAKASASN